MGEKNQLKNEIFSDLENFQIRGKSWGHNFFQEQVIRKILGQRTFRFSFGVKISSTRKKMQVA